MKYEHKSEKVYRKSFAHKQISLRPPTTAAVVEKKIYSFVGAYKCVWQWQYVCTRKMVEYCGNKLSRSLAESWVNAFFAGFRGKYFLLVLVATEKALCFFALTLARALKPLKSSSYIHRLSFGEKMRGKPRKIFSRFFPRLKMTHVESICERYHQSFQWFFLMYVLSCKNCFILDAHIYILSLTRQMLLLVAGPSCGSTLIQIFEFFAVKFYSKPTPYTIFPYQHILWEENELGTLWEYSPGDKDVNNNN